MSLRNMIAAAAVGGALVVAAGCRDAAVTGPEPPGIPADTEPDGPLVMEATIDGRRYTVTDGVGFDVPAIEVVKGGIMVSAVLPSPGGHLTDPLSEYRLQVTSADGPVFPGRVAYIPGGPFSGSLYWIAPGQSVELAFGLYHVTAGRYVLGPYSIVMTRRGDPGTSEPAVPDVE